MNLETLIIFILSVAFIIGIYIQLSTIINAVGMSEEQAKNRASMGVAFMAPLLLYGLLKSIINA